MYIGNVNGQFRESCKKVDGGKRESLRTLDWLIMGLLRWLGLAD